MAECPTFNGLVALTLDRVILHTVVHHSSTSTYIPNLIEIEETLWTDGHLTHVIRSTRIKVKTSHTHY